MTQDSPLPRGEARDVARRRSLSALLRHVHVHGPTTRSRMAALTGLNRSTIGTMTADLVAAGLVQEAPTPTQTGAGRPSFLVTVRSDLHYVLAFDVGVDYLSAARVGLGGQVLDRRSARRSADQHELTHVLRQIRLLASVLVDAAQPASSCVGVGVAIPGLVRHSDGLVRVGPNLAWTDVPLGEAVAETLAGAGVSAPVGVRNDADLAVLAEHLRGAAIGASHAIYITGEVGVGAGVIVEGRPLTGADGYGGEVGHMVVNPAGRRCVCGSRGCWETEVGAAAIVEAASWRGTRTTIAEAVDAARAGNAWAMKAMRQVGDWLALGLGNLVTVFNPEVVVFGGLFQQVLPLVEHQIQEALGTTGLQPPRTDVRITLPALGSSSALIGAAELAFAPLLEDPVGWARS